MVSGDNAVEVFAVNSGTVTISGLTIETGNSTVGGGIYNDGTMVLTNSTVSGNFASGVGGGGINNSGTMTINYSTVSGNFANEVGGGILNDNSGTMTINSSTVSGNRAPTSLTRVAASTTKAR